MVFGLFKKVAGGAAREIKAEYGANKDFLEAAMAASALVAYADGSLGEDERRKALSIASNNKTLSTIYKSADIEACFDTMLKRARDASGRASLARELDDIKNRPDGGKEMSQDVYLMALDIANADGSIGPEEQKMLEKIAGRLGVNPKDFEF